MMYKVDVTYVGESDSHEERYRVSVTDSGTGEEFAQCIWIGKASDALKAGLRMAEAYKKGIKDGEEKVLRRVVDMVETWGGDKL